MVGVLNLTPSSKSNIVKRVVLSEDLSKGLERVPIACVIDHALEPCTCQLCVGAGSLGVQGDSQTWDNFVYITQRLLDPSLGLDTKVCLGASGDKFLSPSLQVEVLKIFQCLFLKSTTFLHVGIFGILLSY